MYSPRDARIDRVMEAFATMNRQRSGDSAWKVDSWTPDLNKENLKGKSNLGVVGVENEDFIYDFVALNPNMTLFGVSFDIRTSPNDPQKTNYQYQIWFNQTETSRKFRPPGAPPFVFRYIEPMNDQVAALMRSLDEAIIIATSTDNTASERLKLKISNFPDIEDSPLVRCPANPDNVFATLGPIFIYIPLSVIFFSTINLIVNEKEKRLKDAMEMIGLMPSLFWISHYLCIAVLILLASIFLPALGVAFQFTLFLKTDFSLLVAIFFVYGLASNALALFISSVCQKVKSAVGFGFFIEIIGVIYVSVGVLAGYAWYTDSSDSTDLSPVWKVCFLLPVFNYNKLITDIFGYTSTTIAITGTRCSLKEGDFFGWPELYKAVRIPSGGTRLLPTNTSNIPKPVDSFGFLVADIFIWFLLALYLDRVLPNENGYSEHPLYFLFPSYWGFQNPQWMTGNRAKLQLKADIPANEDPDVVAERKLANSFQPSAGVRDDAGMRIQSLQKRYHTGLKAMFAWFGMADDKVEQMSSFFGTTKTAVYELSLHVNKGEMLALLGSNGAGKTSTMKIMYGVSPPSSGNAYVFGNDLRTEMSEIRKMLGVCPQFDILFPDMTAREHIELFCGIKGISQKDINNVIEDRLKQVRLWNVRNQFSSQYSGGMKRRLSVILATLGDPQVVFLDEPTTGMDPLNKRYVWKFLEDFKKGRVIILTTHSMEEADILADKIAIMAKGRLKAVGKSIRLKNKYGSGYRVSITVPDAENVLPIKAKVSSLCPDAKLEEEEVIGSNEASSKSARLVYSLESIPKVKVLIQYLELITRNKVKAIGDASLEEKLEPEAKMIGSFGMSQTTLEDVFLKAVKG